MKFMIVSAKELQNGDVLFTTSEQTPDVKFCGRVIGMNPPVRGAETLEYRVEPMVGEEEGHTVLEFRATQRVGVAREDDYVDVDVAALLANLD